MARWRQKYEKAMRLANDPGATRRERSTALAKAVRIKAKYLRNEAQLPRRKGRELLGLVKYPKGESELRAEQRTCDRYQRDHQDGGKRYGSGDTPPRANHGRLARARDERLAQMSRGERRRFLANEREERQRRG